MSIKIMHIVVIPHRYMVLLPKYGMNANQEIKVPTKAIAVPPTLSLRNMLGLFNRVNT